MSNKSVQSPNWLRINPAAEAERIQSAILQMVSNRLKRRGIVVGISGGIDSSVVAALSARALGKERVLGLLMPEPESSGDSERLANLLADSLGIKTQREDIGPILEGARCYERRDEAIRKVLPQYGNGFKCKIVLSDASSAYMIFFVVAESPTGEIMKARLSAEAYLGIVAATNFKQRTRKMMEYYHADRLQYAVAGTPNRLELDQGFFVKNGDGSADLKPIAHLYKTQVYELAKYLRIPQEIQSRPPTTDTYSMQQSQEEFYFSFTYDKMDLLLYGKNNGIPPGDVAPVVGLTAEQVDHAYSMIDSKRKATRYLHLRPLVVEEILDESSEDSAEQKNLPAFRDGPSGHG